MKKSYLETDYLGFCWLVGFAVAFLIRKTLQTPKHLCSTLLDSLQ